MSTLTTPEPQAHADASYAPLNKVRFVTAASLFDGHDASINIMRRILQSTGCEVIHLGHNRAVMDIVDTAIQEDAQGIALSSYQGGHVEFFKYMVDLLRERGAGHIQVFGGGGGVISPEEIRELEAYGVARIFSPEDGRHMGLQGMIDDMVRRCDIDPRSTPEFHRLARRITKIELGQAEVLPAAQSSRIIPVLGITGTGGAGKSSLIDELLRRFLVDFPEKRVAVLSVDPTKRKTGGALLGDRIRMNALYHPELRDRVFMRSLATRSAAHRATSQALVASIAAAKAEGYDLVIVETAGIGQSDSEIADLVDLSMYVMTPEYGAASQLEKIDMLDFADIVVLNKADKRGAEDALRDVRKQVQRAHKRFDVPSDEMPVYATCASQFNDPATNWLFVNLVKALATKTGVDWVPRLEADAVAPRRAAIIPPERVRYLAEIADAVQGYKAWARRQAETAEVAFALWTSLKTLGDKIPPAGTFYDAAHLTESVDGDQGQAILLLRQRYQEHLGELHGESRRLIHDWVGLKRSYTEPENVYVVRGREIRTANYTQSLSGTLVPKVALPPFSSWGEVLRWQLLENLPGQFPFTAGVFEYKRVGEDPTRMFAGEGTPERTNKRFHFVSKGQPAVRLSTAFDSVTLYGEDPHERPDIYGKVGNSGVSVCTVDDAKKLYSGFDLLCPTTSVSMTINGPAPTMLAFFLNAAMDQRAELWLKEQGQLEAAQAKLRASYASKGMALPRYEGSLPEGNDGLGLALLGASAEEVLPPEVYRKIRTEALQTVRGTVQADILKEDQAQNTCIFSTEFSLKVMGDIQQTFIEEKVRNFYSVSISGYHIAEAGANPISQLAFTLANGFTFVEYYLSRGMDIDDFAPNLSFFFSNGLDAEYSVIGRVARRIWSVAMKEKYGANDRSQKLKYHIQTSGRSLHAQEIDFNDIRTTLQALYAIYDNCNSLHTNAYDEAITTPTEASVRRAIAIQLIINRELGQAKNENPLQGAFIIEQLTELVEEAVLAEFRRIADRGGVLGAMETMYQRGKIQEESMQYEHLKHSGELPIVGVNTFLNPQPVELGAPELIRSTEEEKQQQIRNLAAFHARNADRAPAALARLKEVARSQGNLFEELLEAAKVCSLGQISQALYEVGGQYRRNM
ncbi:MAG TPA: methylmalonyl-CoA mutase family protein [Geothrix sp.]|nr:methylmalonyl-CoA mutase family protein [Geothrix sp.]